MGVVLSHNISTLLVVVASSIFVIVNVKKLFAKDTRKSIWKNLIINGCFIILISMFFYGPLLEHKSATDYFAFTSGATKEDFVQSRLYPSQLFFSREQLNWVNRLDSDNINNSMSFSLGIPIIVALLFTPLVFNKIKKEYKFLYVFTLLVGIIFTIMTTTVFPWSKMPIVPAVIQFPWRLLYIATFAFSIISGINIYKSIDNVKLENMYVVVLVIMICSKMFISNVVKYDTQFDISYLYLDNKMEEKQCAAYEYLPTKAKENFDYVYSRENRSNNIIW